MQIKMYCTKFKNFNFYIFSSYLSLEYDGRVESDTSLDIIYSEDPGNEYVPEKIE